jgi:hypothetical protein
METGLNKTSEEKNEIFAQLLDNYIEGRDIFCKPERPKTVSIEEPEDSRRSLQSIDKEFDKIVRDSSSNEGSSKSIKGLSSLTLIGGKKFLMLDKSTREKNQRKELLSFLKHISPQILKIK